MIDVIEYWSLVGNATTGHPLSSPLYLVMDKIPPLARIYHSALPGIRKKQTNTQTNYLYSYAQCNSCLPEFLAP